MLVARLAGDAFAAGAGIAVGQLDAGGLQVGVQFAGGDLVAADGERLGEGHVVQRALVGLAADLVVRGAHGEAAGGQYDHLRAVLAILEHRAGFLRFVGEGWGGGDDQCGQGQGR